MMKLPKETLARIRKVKRKEDLAQVARLQRLVDRQARKVIGSVEVTAVSKPDIVATQSTIS